MVQMQREAGSTLLKLRQLFHKSRKHLVPMYGASGKVGGAGSGHAVWIHMCVGILVQSYSKCCLCHCAILMNQDQQIPESQ